MTFTTASPSTNATSAVATTEPPRSGPSSWGESRTDDFLARNPNGRIPTLELDDGRILVGGGVVNGHTEQLAVWCLQPDGQLDTNFAEGGVFLLPGMGRATALAPDGDGVLVSGFLFHANSGTDVALVRLLP